MKAGFSLLLIFVICSSFVLGGNQSLYCFTYKNGTSACLNCSNSNLAIASDGIPYCVDCNEGFVFANNECVLNSTKMVYNDNDTLTRLDIYVRDYVPGGWFGVLVLVFILIVLYLEFRPKPRKKVVLLS